MKIFSLTYNELVKLFKKTSIKIIFALILISAMVLPLIISKLPEDPYLNSNLENQKYQLEQSKIQEDDLKDDKTQKGRILYKYAQIDREYNQILVDYKVGYDSWKNYAAQNYKNTLYELAAIEFVIDGFKEDVVIKNLQGVDFDKAANYYKLSLEKKKEIQSSLEKNKDELKRIIDEDDYIGHTKEQIKGKYEVIAIHEKTIKDYEKLKNKKDKTKEEKERLEVLEKDINELKNIIANTKIDIEVLNFRIENKIDYSPSNWRNNSLQTIEKELTELGYKLLPEKEYSIQVANQVYSMSYDDYVKDYNKKREERIDNIKTIWFGIENNIPDLNDISDARSIFDSTYEIYIIMAVIMVIIIGGGIVSNEFTNGTIRLLLIRPVSRWKILALKLLAVLTVGFSLVILGIGILYISTGMVYGFETYNTPMLEIINGSVVQSSFYSYVLPKIITSCSSLVFISSLVFMISTVSKNTALSVAISMLVYLGSVPLASMIVSIKQTWIVNTFIPYINASYFRLVHTVPEFLTEQFGMSMQYSSGAIQLLILSLIMLVVSFINFVKKDVKN